MRKQNEERRQVSLLKTKWSFSDRVTTSQLLWRQFLRPEVNGRPALRIILMYLVTQMSGPPPNKPTKRISHNMNKVTPSNICNCNIQTRAYLRWINTIIHPLFVLQIIRQIPRCSWVMLLITVWFDNTWTIQASSLSMEDKNSEHIFWQIRHNYWKEIRFCAMNLSIYETKSSQAENWKHHNSRFLAPLWWSIDKQDNELIWTSNINVRQKRFLSPEAVYKTLTVTNQVMREYITIMMLLHYKTAVCSVVFR